MKHSTDLHLTQRHSRLSAECITLLSFAVLLILSLVSLNFGSFALDFFSEEKKELSLKIFQTLRLPRILAAILAGGVLGVTGAVCQTVFCNPLASPDITGVASGASFGAAAAILLGVSGIMRTGIAFVGGMLALVILLFFVRISGASGEEHRSRYILAGILVSAAADAGLMILKTAADPERELAAIEFWTMGSFASITDKRFLIMALASVPALILLFLFNGQTLILSRGSADARSVGLSPALWQAILLLLSTLSVAGVVSTVGVIGFVGLIVPHMALALIKKRGKAFLFLCFSIGASITVLSDLLARTVVSEAELPVSIFCVGFAVIWFSWLFARRKVTGGENDA